MTPQQEARLKELCARYEVDYNADHYYPVFDLPHGYVAGWVGGPKHGPPSGKFNASTSNWIGKTLYVGVSPEGNASS